MALHASELDLAFWKRQKFRVAQTIHVTQYGLKQ
jgi:hypothetical protein